MSVVSERYNKSNRGCLSLPDESSILRQTLHALNRLPEMKHLWIWIWLLPVGAWAQINESDTLDFKAKLALTGIFQEGNVETLIFRARTDISAKPLSSLVFKTSNSYVYQAFGGQKADADILSLNFLYLHPERKVYPLLLGFVSSSFRRKIDLRSLLGMGVSFQLLDQKTHWLKLSLSMEYEQTRFSETNFNLNFYDEQEAIRTFRTTLWVNGRYELWDKKVVLTHESYVQPSLERGDNFRWQADLGLELPVWKFLTFKVNYLHSFESVVIQDQKQEDRFLTFGFSVQTY